MGMARNIIEGGFPLTGFDLREARLAELDLAGGTRCELPRGGRVQRYGLCHGTHGDEVKQALFGEDGVVLEMRAGGTVVISATIHPSEVKDSWRRRQTSKSTSLIPP